jgi:ATP synthase F1 complex assembly factor 1
MFVIPLAKPNGGFQTMLLQWQLPVAMVTGLADFKAAGPNATPHLTITHYEELAGSKGVVLVAGDVIAEGQLSVPEVGCLGG